MGADMISISLIAEEGATLRWDYVEEAIAELDDDQLGEVSLDLAYAGYDAEVAEEVKDEARAAFQELAEIIRDEQTRDVNSWTFRGATLWVTGGLSWGDSPTESYDVFERVWRFPSVLKAIGFIVEGDFA